MLIQRKELWYQVKKHHFFDQIDFVKSFYYLGDGLNASGGSKVAVTPQTRIEWIKFKGCGELLYARKFSLKMKGKIYQRCVRLTML